MRDLFPRQSGSGGAPSSGSAITPSTSSGSIDTSVQTSGFTTATAVTTPVFSSQLSSTPFSADVTTTPVTTGTTSQPQTTTSASPSTSPTHPSSTPPPTSTSTSPSTSSQPTSSSTVPSSTSALPSSITPPPTSFSPPETQTTITSTYTIDEGGTPVVTSTAIPTTIPLVSESSSSNRTAVIAGSAAGGTALLILLLSLAFFARRKRFKRLDFLDALTYKRKQARTRESFLAGEDLDDVDLARPPLRYADYDTPWDDSTRALMMGRQSNSGPGTPGTGTMPERWSETGSAFKEDVWPPPNEGTHLMDPLANRVDLDLSRIVDDVMGPSDNTVVAHFTDRSVSSMYRGSGVDSDGMHSRTISTGSNAALLEAAGLGGTITAPVRSSPLAQQGTTPRSAENAS